MPVYVNVHVCIVLLKKKCTRLPDIQICVVMHMFLFANQTSCMVDTTWTTRIERPR